MVLRTLAAVLTIALVSSVPGARAADGRPTDRQIEQYLLDIPTATGALDDSAKLDEESHYPGSSGDRKMAVWMRDLLASYGFNAAIEPVYAQVPILHRAVLQLLERPRIDFDLREMPIAQDADGSRGDAGLPFNAWSGSGDVTAAVVYVNRGLDADYAVLKAAGVDVAGKIVLIRYGAQFRGDLARRAADRGAAGVIFYSDPSDKDGADNGSAYPDGPYRPLGSVQRGSLGGPVLSIPVLPVSALTARRLLESVTAGEEPPAGWRGGLDASYALGSSDAPVHLRVDLSNNWIWLWNTVGVLPGLDSSHEVVLGAHRDAWVYGVTDNGSGVSSLLEAARALGFVYRAGWRPRYSIVIGGWDGEEIGLAGSGAYVRTHSWNLRHGCLAYVNADEVSTGDVFRTDGVAALAAVTPPLARMVPDPRVPTRTVWDRWRLQPGGVQIEAPGGGSDHASFLYLLGIPTIESRFNGPFGVYHSAFDDLRYATTQADPRFMTHQAVARLLALTAFRLTQGAVPYRFDTYVVPMQQALAALAHNNGSGADLSPVAAAIDRFSNADGGSGTADLKRAIEAVDDLDLIFYGREGYEPVAFPKLAAAMASGDRNAVTAAVTQTASDLDAVTALLK